MFKDIELKIRMLDEGRLINAGYITDTDVGMKDLDYEHDNGFYFNTTTFTSNIPKDYDFGLSYNGAQPISFEVCEEGTKDSLIYFDCKPHTPTAAANLLTPQRMLHLFKVADELDRILSA
jgi:hypothetical protein